MSRTQISFSLKPPVNYLIYSNEGLLRNITSFNEKNNFINFEFPFFSCISCVSLKFISSHYFIISHALNHRRRHLTFDTISFVVKIRNPNELNWNKLLEMASKSKRFFLVQFLTDDTLGVIRAEDVKLSSNAVCKIRDNIMVKSDQFIRFGRGPEFFEAVILGISGEYLLFFPCLLCCLISLLVMSINVYFKCESLFICQKTNQN